MNYVVIVAGGAGTRMGKEIPKQFLEVDSKPILMHTIDQFIAFDSNIVVIVVLPADQIDYWQKLCLEHHYDKKYILTKGGLTRFQSVKNGLSSINGDQGIVAIHDGVRPFISTEIIKNSFLMAATKGNAVVSVALKDSIRLKTRTENKSVPRQDYVLIQTPQVFELSSLKKAYLTEELPTFTDDASVFEHAGYSIELIEGSYENIKITTPEDLLVAEIYAKKLRQ